jgi:hypothetical protein
MIKQTAVQELIVEMESLINKPYVNPKNALTDCINLAYNKLQMEREQIELAFDEGLEYEYEHHINGYPRIEPSTYYKETYGGQDEK